MSQVPIGLIGTLHISFGFHPLLYPLRTSAGTKLGAARITNNLFVANLRKNSTIAITRSSQQPSVKRIANLEHHRYVVNNMSLPTNIRSSATLSSLSVGLAASHYLLGIRKVIYCTENKGNKGTQTVESTSEKTLFSSQSSTKSQTTKENITSSSSSPSSPPSSSDKRPFSPFDLFNFQQITFGTSMGFASGYFVKAVSKTAAVSIGAVFVLLRILEHQGYITIRWNKFEENYNKMLDFDKDGKITTNDFKLIFYKVVEYLGRNFQSDAGFVIGFGVGFRYG